jgi:putative acetyltransferase
MSQHQTFEIRPATNADHERIKAVVFGVLAEYGLSPDCGKTDVDLDDIENHYFASGGLFEVVEDERGELVGTVGLYVVDSKTCELRKMYLAPQARGQGLGKLLLERTIEQARQRSFQRIVLETASVLKEAIHLYTRFGFAPMQSDHLATRCDQAYVLHL